MLARVRFRVLRALGTLTLIAWAVLPRALKDLILTLANIIEPAGCKGLWGYGGWFVIRNHFELFLIE